MMCTAGSPDVAQGVSQVLRDLEKNGGSAGAHLRVETETFQDTNGQEQNANTNANAYRKHSPSYEVTVDTLCELEHLRVRVEVSPRSSLDGGELQACLQSHRVFGPAVAFDAFNDRLHAGLLGRKEMDWSIGRAPSRTGAASAPPTLQRGFSSGRRGLSGPSGLGGAAGDENNVAASSLRPAGVTEREQKQLRQLARLASLASDDSVESLANEPAAEGAAASLCKLLYRASKCDRVQEDADLHRAVVGLLRSRSPVVFRYAVIAASLFSAVPDLMESLPETARPEVGRRLEESSRPNERADATTAATTTAATGGKTATKTTGAGAGRFSGRPRMMRGPAGADPADGLVRTEVATHAKVLLALLNASNPTA
jgi:hypothetical protein